MSEFSLDSYSGNSDNVIVIIGYIDDYNNAINWKFRLKEGVSVGEGLRYIRDIFSGEADRITFREDGDNYSHVVVNRDKFVSFEFYFKDDEEEDDEEVEEKVHAESDTSQPSEEVVENTQQ